LKQGPLLDHFLIATAEVLVDIIKFEETNEPLNSKDINRLFIDKSNEILTP